MRNLLAVATSALVLGLAAPAMAQTNTSTVKQDGNHQIAHVEQIGGDARNDSRILQGLKRHSTGNEARVNQDGSNGLKNYSTVVQDGHDNFSKTDQTGNGVGNDRNESTTIQDGRENVARVIQGDLVRNNSSMIRQIGKENFARVRQGGNEGINKFNDSWIRQDGNHNTAKVDQGGDVADLNNSSLIRQDGNLNTAKVSQSGSSGNLTNTSHVYQTGTGNMANVTQH